MAGLTRPAPAAARIGGTLADLNPALLFLLRAAALAWWLAAASVQAATAPPPGARAALMATTLSAPAVQWLHLADALRDAGDVTSATLLRHHLLAAHVDALNGAAAPQPAPRVADAIDAARQRPAPVSDGTLMAAWEEAYNRHVQIQLAEPGLPAPPEVAYLGSQLTPLGPGAWTMDAAGRARYFWVLWLVNRSPTTLPLTATNVRADGLLLDCQPPAPPLAGDVRRPGQLDDPGERVAPGASRPFVCRAFEGPEFRAPLAQRLAGQAATAPRLLPTHLGSSAQLDALLDVLGQGQDRQRAAWSQRLSAGAAAPGAVGASPTDTATGATVATGAAGGAGALAAGTAARTASRWQRLRVLLAVGAVLSLLGVGLVQLFGRLSGHDAAPLWARSARWTLGVMVLALLVGLPWTQQLLGSATDDLGARATSALRESVRSPGPNSAAHSGQAGLQLATHDPVKLALAAGLLVFGLGRLALRAGLPRGVVVSASVGFVALAALGTAAWTVTQMPPASGEGWGRAAVILVPIWVIAMFMLAGIEMLLLHRLHFLLDEDGLSWPGSVMAGLRRSLDFTGNASRGEFWGFIAFALLATALVRGWDLRLGGMLMALLVLPCAALAVRRLRAMSTTEAWGAAALLGLFIIELLTSLD